MVFFLVCFCVMNKQTKNTFHARSVNTQKISKMGFVLWNEKLCSQFSVVSNFSANKSWKFNSAVDRIVLYADWLLLLLLWLPLLLLLSLFRSVFLHFRINLAMNSFRPTIIFVYNKTRSIKIGTCHQMLSQKVVLAFPFIFIVTYSQSFTQVDFRSTNSIFVSFLFCLGLVWFGAFPFLNAKYFFQLINVGSKSFLTRI